jgi:hypothetical protein
MDILAILFAAAATSIFDRRPCWLTPATYMYFVDCRGIPLNIYKCRKPGAKIDARRFSSSLVDHKPKCPLVLFMTTP